MQILYLMQGVPGSGKSFIANILAEKVNAVVCSTDYYHYVDGKYVFQPNRLAEFHELNFNRVKLYLEGGMSVIVDNTNIKKQHAQKYIELAKSLGIPTQVIRVQSDFTNSHGVPQHKVEKMKKEMEDLYD